MQQPNLCILPFLFRWRFILAVLFALLILLSQSCSKTGSAPATDDLIKAYFETNVLNRDFKVFLATDSGVDITSQYDNYVFRLMKNTYFDGPMTGTKNGVTISGTWSSNDDFSKLVISLNQPSAPAGFTFLNRQWRFTRKAFPLMELAPWGSTDPKVLQMLRL
ncbi:MAG: hypothetical protein ABIY51_06425 [Ferruginibacter sp.]